MQDRLSKQILKWLAAAAGTLVVAVVTVLIGFSTRLSPLVRNWVVGAVSERYESDVQVKSLNVSLFPLVRVTGEGLMLRHRGRTDVPPLASIKRLSVDAALLGFLRSPKRFRTLQLEGLEISVPPRRDHADQDRSQARKPKRPRYPFVIGEVVADGTVLNIFSKNPDKPPHTFHIYKLRLHSLGMGRPMSFRATLTNPTPPGQIQTAGDFGPWQADDPGLTSVSGSYTFRDADLSVFRGIAGLLSSQGKYQGVLRRVEVQGETDTPDFAVAVSGNPVYLKTHFNAVVDGTNGDTLLQQVEAHFLHSSMLYRGRVAGKVGIKGKTISLDVTATDARLEDLLRLAAKGDKPPLTGAMTLQTHFLLPPGHQDITDKLNLNGGFQISRARFTSPTVQQKVQTLSRRGRSQKDGSDVESVASNLRGHFVLKSGVMTFSNLSFAVPGASVHLTGSYGLRSEQLDFHGALRLEARLSQTTTGIKSFLLKAVDPLFAGNRAGTVLPIDITGTRDQPSFKVDIRRAIFKR